MIYIPTCGRWARIKTIENFSPWMLDRTCLVVQEKEFFRYGFYYFSKVHKIIVLPKNITTIEPTRRFIWERTESRGINKFFIIDDDLTFHKRIPGDPKHSRSISGPKELENIFREMYRQLDHYPSVGLSERLGNNREEEEWKEITRCVRCVGYNHKAIPFEKLKFGRMEVMEDYDITLQLFQLGLKNNVWFKYMQEQGNSNQKGGCSSWRTLELHNANAIKLAKFHPEFVKVVEKKTKHGWFNKEGVNRRLDVRIQWRKCFEFSQT